MSDSTSSNGSSDNTAKALITVGVLGGACIVAIIVAKIVDYCYDHHVSISDDASDISEHTRDLIRLRMTAVTAFRGGADKKKKEDEESPAEVSAKQKRLIRLWSAKAKESRQIAEKRRAEELAKQQLYSPRKNITNNNDDEGIGEDKNNDFIIRVEEAPGDGKLTASLVPPSGEGGGGGGAEGGEEGGSRLHPLRATSRNSSLASSGGSPHHVHFLTAVASLSPDNQRETSDLRGGEEEEEGGEGRDSERRHDNGERGRDNANSRNMDDAAGTSSPTGGRRGSSGRVSISPPSTPTPRPRIEFPGRPDFQRTLSGLDSSNCPTLDFDNEAVEVALCASGNSSVLGVAVKGKDGKDTAQEKSSSSNKGSGSPTNCSNGSPTKSSNGSPTKGSNNSTPSKSSNNSTPTKSSNTPSKGSNNVNPKGKANGTGNPGSSVKATNSSPAKSKPANTTNITPAKAKNNPTKGSNNNAKNGSSTNTTKNPTTTTNNTKAGKSGSTEQYVLKQDDNNAGNSVNDGEKQVDTVVEPGASGQKAGESSAEDGNVKSSSRPISSQSRSSRPKTPSVEGRVRQGSGSRTRSDSPAKPAKRDERGKEERGGGRGGQNDRSVSPTKTPSLDKGGKETGERDRSVSPTKTLQSTGVGGQTNKSTGPGTLSQSPTKTGNDLSKSKTVPVTPVKGQEQSKSGGDSTPTAQSKNNGVNSTGATTTTITNDTKVSSNASTASPTHTVTPSADEPENLDGKNSSAGQSVSKSKSDKDAKTETSLKNRPPTGGRKFKTAVTPADQNASSSKTSSNKVGPVGVGGKVGELTVHGQKKDSGGVVIVRGKTEDENNENNSKISPSSQSNSTTPTPYSSNNGKDNIPNGTGGGGDPSNQPTTTTTSNETPSPFSNSPPYTRSKSTLLPTEVYTNATKGIVIQGGDTDVNAPTLTRSPTKMNTTTDGGGDRCSSPTKLVMPSPTHNPKPETVAAYGSVVGPAKKPRPKSYNNKEEYNTDMPSKLATSVKVYEKASEDLQIHKSLVTSKKKTAATMATTAAIPISVPTTTNEDGTPLVPAAQALMQKKAMRKLKSKSAKT